MKHLTKITLSALAAISLVACSADTDPAAMEKQDPAEMDHSQMDPDGDMNVAAKGDTGHTTGTLVSVSPDGQSATIKHEAIDGVGMGAMTMGFEITSSVDLTAYTASDPVSFMVKRGRDGSYRITAICNTETDGKDCLSAQMEHAEH
ncbi:MAG: copper-binding protein [Litorimonas sp.]